MKYAPVFGFPHINGGRVLVRTGTKHPSFKHGNAVFFNFAASKARHDKLAGFWKPEKKQAAFKPLTYKPVKPVGR